jgi:Maltokinase N-terminal cap domain
MGVVHQTTLRPSKMELLAPWLPAQPWYAGTGREPELARVGGFRLDDPRGEVGIEFMVVSDGSLFYHVPLTYRGAPLDGADHALIGTAEHGVLGRRWVYDGTHDPVLVTQLLALLQGRAEPQAQSASDTPDRSVTVYFSGAGVSGVVSADVANGPDGTDLVVASPGALTVRVTRVLRPDQEVAGATVLGHVTAGWRLPEGGESRGRFVVVRDADQRF